MGYLYYKFRNGLIFRISVVIVILVNYVHIGTSYSEFISTNYPDVQYISAAPLILLGVILFGISAYYLHKSVIQPINLIVAEGERLAKGKTTISLPEWTRKDEIGSLIESLKKISSFYDNTFTQITETSENIASSALNLSTASEEMNATSEQISSLSQAMAYESSSQDTNLTNIVQDITKFKQKFDEHMTTIKNSAQLIDSISTQVNMLSLNASIEAARAGEYGRGFSVVADNIRGLSDNTKTTLNDINDSIIETESTLSQSISEIVVKVKQLSVISSKTAIKSEEVSSATQEQTATAEEMTASAQSLSDLSDKLNEFLQNFNS